MFPLAETRILVLSSHDASLDRRIVAQINSLAAAGASLSLLTIPVELAGAGLDPRVRVTLTPSHPVARQHAGLKRLLRALSTRFYHRLRSARYARGHGPAEPLCDAFLQHAPPGPFDLLHCHDLPTLPAGARLRDRWPTAKLIYDSHELFPAQFDDPHLADYWHALEARHVHAADAVVTVNPSIAAELARRHRIPTPTVIYNSFGLPPAPPIDESRFAAHFGLTGAGPLVLYQGGLVDGRNLDPLLRAFAELRHTARLLLLGDGPLQPALAALRRSLSLSNVFFGPWVAPDCLLAFTARADLGIIPYPAASNLNTRLCTPNKLFEFIEAGLPICASDLPELRRIVADRGIGAVYPMHSAADVAFAVRDCLDRSRRGHFTRQARDSARLDFAWSRQADTLTRLYHTLLNPPAAGAARINSAPPLLR